MSALGFLGGLGMAANSIKRGYDEEVDRQAALQDREFQRQQREFQKGQQQRLLTEQKRADDLRAADAAVPTKIQIPVTSEGTIDGQKAPVVRDDEGNLLPGAVETRAASTETRSRGWDQVFRDYASNRRDRGDVAGAEEFEGKARKISADNANRQATSLIAQSGNMSFVDYANAARDMFNSDVLPQSITGITPNTDGSITVQIKHNDSGQATSRTYKSKDELTNAIRSQYQPETFMKLQQAAEEARIKNREELFKPRVLKPGEVLQAYDPEQGKMVKIAEGNIPAGYEVLTDPNGNTVLRKVDGGARAGNGTGTGAGGKAPKEDIDAATGSLKDALGRSDGTPEGAQRYTRTVSYLDGIYANNPGITQRTAAAIAADAAADPSRVTMQIDHKTGLVGKVYSNPDFDGGRQYNLAPAGATTAEMEKSVGVKGMQTAVSGMIDSMLAPVPEEQRATARQQLIQLASNPAERKAYIDAANAAGKDTAAVQRQLDLIGRYNKPAPPPPDKREKTSVGGMQYTPPPGSPSAQYMERQAKLRAQAQEQERQRAAAQQALSQQFKADRAAMKPEEFVRKYEALRGRLPAADAAELNRIWASVR